MQAHRHLRGEAQPAARAGLQLVDRAFGVLEVARGALAERVELEANDRLALARTRQATALVSLYAALAGGWPERLPAAGDPIAHVAVRAEVR